jgi:Flp pilus assembly protein TadD
MRKFVVVTSLVLSLVVTIVNAQIRGTGRLQGNVFDKATGKPIAGATVTIGFSSGNTRPIVVKTDSKGHWAAIGMTSGQWNVDITAPGYVTSRGTASISEVTTAPPIRTQLEPEAKAEPAPAVAAPASPSVPKEAVDAIKEAQDLVKIAAGDVITTTQPSATGAPTAVSHTVTADEVKDNAKRAVADLEKALPMIPEDTQDLRDVKNQVMQVLAQAYYKAGDVKSAIATFEKLDTTDPMPATPDAAHTTREVLLANLYLENGQLEQGKALLDKLPSSAITDPTAYTNIGILFLNKNNPADAATYFTRAIQLDPKRAETYYYRGLAEVQMKKNKEARADLEQVVALSPNSSEAHDAKQLLANLK